MAQDDQTMPLTERARVNAEVAIAHIRWEANEAPRESTRRFQEMLDALPGAVYITDAEGRLTYFNQAAVEFSGRVPELGSDQWCVSWKLYYPDGRPMPHEECPMAIAIKEGRPVRGVEAIAERPDGTRIWFVPYPTPLRDTAGRVVGGINMLMDITERRRAEEALRQVAEFQAKLAAIVEFSDDAIISKSLDGIITSWNRGAERLFGYTAEEAIGQAITILFPPDRFHEEAGILERIRRGEPIDHFETVRRRKDGTLVDVSLSISPVRGADGRIVGISKIVRDITERKRAEELEREREERRRDELVQALRAERRITEALQRSLLPTLPKTDSVHFAARYIPASTDLMVGGDFYDIFVLPDGRLGLAIGDVAGHGVQAASTMGQVRMLLRAYAHEEYSPGDILDRLNRLLPSGEMVTVLYLLLDPSSGEVTYANAGHPPPLIVSRDGTSRFLDGHNLPLFGSVHRYRSFHAAVARTSTVILYTDGLVESGKSIEVGMTVLAEIAGAASSAELDHVVDAIVGALAGGTEHRDDVALLAFRLNPV
jgi:PAS domain S-box-containing protein